MRALKKLSTTLVGRYFLGYLFKDTLVNEIFSKLSSEADHYALNRFLIHEIEKMFPDTKNFHGVDFLSVEDPPGTNFAVFGDAILQLEPGIVNLVRITDIDEYGYVAFQLLKNAKPKDGHLEWPAQELKLS